MGRTKCFSREKVLEAAIPVFWKSGFADTSVQDLERSTGVNKSGLYSEFKDKEDLYLSALGHYIARSGVGEMLGREPLGWDNVVAFLKSRLEQKPKGCFVVNSVRELSGLPPAARALIAEHMGRVRALMAENLRAEKIRMPAEDAAELVLTFNAGLCLEQNLLNQDPQGKIENFLKVLRKL